MAWEKPYFSQSFVAGEDLRTHQYKFVELATDGEVELCDAATDIPIGVLQNNPNVGELAVVMVVGVSKVIAAAAIANIGTMIGTDASGLAAAKTIGTDITNYVVGRNLEAAGGANAVIACYIDCIAPSRAA